MSSLLLNTEYLRDESESGNLKGLRLTRNKKLNTFKTKHKSNLNLFENTGTEKKNNVNSFFIYIIIALSTILIIEILFHIFIAPKMRINNIKINTDMNIGLTDGNILEIAGLTSREFYFMVNASEVQKRLNSYAVIKNAEVKKVFPDTINLNITLRKPLGLLLLEMSGMTVPVGFDEQGVMFQIGNSVTNWNLPVISGIDVKEVSLGTKLTPEIIPFLNDLFKIRENSPELFSVISEIKFVKKSNLDFEVVLFLSDKKYRILISKNIDSELLKYILIAADAVSEKGLEQYISELDFRAGEAVYRIREE